MNNITGRIRIFFLSILYVLLVFRYGVDVPSPTLIKQTTFDNGAVTCEQTDNGAETSFTMLLERKNRPLLTKGAFDGFEMKVFQMDDGIVLGSDEVLNYRVVYDDTIPAVDVSYTGEVENDPYLVRDGEQFTVVVHLTFPKGTAPGVYSIALSFSVFDERVYENVLIVP